MSKISVPTIQVDPAPFQSVKKTIRQNLESGDRLLAALKLSEFKMKTILGKQIPEELRPEVSKHIAMMCKNRWLTEDDMQWCHLNNF